MHQQTTARASSLAFNQAKADLFYWHSVLIRRGLYERASVLFTMLKRHICENWPGMAGIIADNFRKEFATPLTKAA